MKSGTKDMALVRKAFALADAGRIDDAFQLVDPGIEVANVVTGRSSSGAPAARRGLERRLQGRRWHVDQVQFLTIADRVLASGHIESKSALGAPIALPVCWAFLIRGGKIARMDIFASERHARRSLSPAPEPD